MEAERVTPLTGQPIKRRYQLVLEHIAEDEGAADRRLRAALKWLLRVHRLRVVTIEPASVGGERGRGGG